MIARREKLQYGYLFVTDFVSLVASVAVAWLIMDGLFGKMTDFREPRLVLEACVMLFIAYVLTFSFSTRAKISLPGAARGKWRSRSASIRCWLCWMWRAWR